MEIRQCRGRNPFGVGWYRASCEREARPPSQRRRRPSGRLHRCRRSRRPPGLAVAAASKWAVLRLTSTASVRKIVRLSGSHIRCRGANGSGETGQGGGRWGRGISSSARSPATPAWAPPSEPPRGPWSTSSAASRQAPSKDFRLRHNLPPFPSLLRALTETFRVCGRKARSSAPCTASPGLKERTPTVRT